MVNSSGGGGVAVLFLLFWPGVGDIRRDTQHSSGNSDLI